jgi:PelA/Pel-15E family pectate lyase
MRLNLLLVTIVVGCICTARASEADLRVQAREALRRGAEFFAREVAVQGTYLWRYSADLKLREGEGKATATQGWVQPPGTPAVGMALLTAWEATGDQFYLRAATETAHALAHGQLRSGGWTYFIDFDPRGKRPLAYRLGKSGKKALNVTTFDDDTTQAALRFLIRTDVALECKDELVHDAVRYGLESLLKAQYPNGAWPQGYVDFPDPAKYPVVSASYPESWPRVHPGGDYWNFYTFNDNALATLIDTMFAAAETYGSGRAGPELAGVGERCRAAAERAGDFILLARMPEPQPAWAQQYDFEMHPTWARKFEPPAITGGESQQILRTLIRLYYQTGNAKYLKPIPGALAYLKRSRLPNGRLARFYELRTNKPLYFTKDYQLTDSDADVPTHYAFMVEDGTEAIRREYEAARAGRPAQTRGRKVSEGEVKVIISTQDARGAWVEPGGLRYHGPGERTDRVIRSATFIRNVETLSGYISSSAGKE